MRIILMAVLIVAMAVTTAMANQTIAPDECGKTQFTCKSGQLNGFPLFDYDGSYSWACGNTDCHIKLASDEVSYANETCKDECRGRSVGDVGAPHGCSPWCYSHCDWQAAGCREMCTTADGSRGNRCPDGRCRVETGEPCL